MKRLKSLLISITIFLIVSSIIYWIFELSYILTIKMIPLLNALHKIFSTVFSVLFGLLFSSAYLIGHNKGGK